MTVHRQGDSAPPADHETMIADELEWVQQYLPEHLLRYFQIIADLGRFRTIKKPWGTDFSIRWANHDLVRKALKDAKLRTDPTGRTTLNRQLYEWLSRTKRLHRFRNHVLEFD